MKSFVKTKKGLANLTLAVAVLAGSCGYLGYSAYESRQVMFHDLTVELGTDSVSIRDFMTDAARGSQVDFVTDPSTVDLNRVGSTEITLKHGSKTETVTLTVQDTTAPTAKIETARTVPVSMLPQAEELVSDVQDASAVRIYYAQKPVVSVDYSNVTVVVVVEDESGNKLEQECEFTYQWMKDNYMLELGDTLTADMLLLNPQRDITLLDQRQLNLVNNGGLGAYEVTAVLDDKQASCTVAVQDTRGPALNLKEVHRRPGSVVLAKDYVDSVSDPSGVLEVRMVGEAPDRFAEGKHTVTIEAEDCLGNVTRQETTLWIARDMTPPTIRGYNTPIVMAKNTSPDFLAGVKGYDAKDGECEVSVDLSELDAGTGGTYYITYTATDSSGNSVSRKRRVEVDHDEGDTEALVRRIADTLPEDPEKIRDYVRRTVGYNSDWGGGDPVWHGFTRKSGNCYVHALCLQALLEVKGYETQLIWVTNESHYWLIIKLGNVWRHIDATPGSRHSRYSLMTDEQRLATLSGRYWDFTQWPACE